MELRTAARFDKPATVLYLTEKQIKSGSMSHLRDSALAAEISAIVKAGGFVGKARQIFPLFHRKKLILLAGIGNQADLTSIELRVIIRQSLISSHLKKITSIELVPFADDPKTIQAMIEGTLLGSYSWNKYKDADEQVDKKFFLVTRDTAAAIKNVTVSKNVNYARDLVNDNADLITAEYFEKIIRAVVKGNKNIRLEVLGRKELQAKGLNLHLAVNQGSRKEPRLIIVRYQGSTANAPYTAIVGKGITFDSGGLNLKPTGSMETMRCDMSGAAAVVATLKNILALKVNKNIVFAVAMAENTIGPGAFKPGDVLRGYNGKTVEILNTDAEGRLVLADAIAYVIKNYQPARLIDIATLTGACVIALGHDHTGLVSNNDELADKILAAAKSTDDRVWRLPNYPELKDAIKSQIADLKNTGLPKGAASTCTAAEFLRQFTNDVPWAHLDIAGTAFMEGTGRSYFAFGGTGAGVRLLTDFLKNI